MAGLSGYSDDELWAAAGLPQPGAAPASAPAPQPQAAPDLSGHSDAELYAAAGLKPGGPLPSAAPQPYQYGVLPLREDPDGSTHLDFAKGLPGAVWDSLKLPGDVYKGNVDPMSPEGRARTTNLASMMTMDAVPIAPLATRKGVQPVPTTDQLKEAASAGYNAARATGAEYPGSDVSSLLGGIQTGLQSDGFLPILAPKTHAVLDQFKSAPEGSTVTISSLDAARKALGKIGPNAGDRTDMAAAQAAIDGLDHYISSAGNAPAVGAAGADLVGGANSAGSVAPTQAQLDAARLLPEARANRAAAYRGDSIDKAEYAASTQADAANSGKNGGNALRQRARSLLLNDKATRGFSPEERAALEQVVQGTWTGNRLRDLGNALGGGGGLGQMATGAIGYGLGSLFGNGAAGMAALPTAGAMARGGYNALVARQMAKVEELMRQRSPLYQQTPAPVVPSLMYPVGNAAMRAGLLGASQSQGLLDR